MRRLISIIAILLFASGIAACEHMEGADEIDDPTAIKKGPGVFTGRSGEWTIIRK
jgi:hypothetical protein